MSLELSAGTETRVNTTTANDQHDPSVTGLSDGGYVVTWMSLSQDGSGYGVYAQRYDATGNPVGSETRVNTTTASHQEFPTVAALSDGGYVVTWMSLSQDGSAFDLSSQNGPAFDIYAQRYNATGNPVGSETHVNTTTANQQFYPWVTGLLDGGYVVTWTSISQDGSGHDIYAQRYDASGNTVGSETRVNTTTAGPQYQSTVAALSDGGYVVTWGSPSQDGSGWGVYAHRYDASGNTVGSETHVNTTTAGDELPRQRVAALSDGGYVVTWRAQDGSGDGVYAQRYDASGNTVGSETRVNTTTAGDQLYPSVTGLSDGGYVVTWMSNPRDGSSVGIYAQQYDQLGNAVGGEIQVNTTTASDQIWPSIAALSDGGYVVTWTSDSQDGSGYNVYSRVFAFTAPDLDALVANFVTNFAQPIQLLTNDGSGNFTATDLDGGSQGSRGIALGDIDGDSDLDALVANDGPPNKLLTNDGSGNFTATDLDGGSQRSYDIALGDIDGDGDLDALVANNGGPNQLLTNDGSGNFTTTDLDGGSQNSWDIALGDIDADGDLDAFVANDAQPNQLLTNDGSGNFTATDLDGGSQRSFDIALGDIDGDGDLDALVGNFNTTIDQLLTNDGSGNFTATDLDGGSQESVDISLGDIDGDGDLDALVANNGGPNKLLTNDGSGNFTATDLPGGFQSSLAIALGDIDGDGDLDALVANSNLPNQLLTNDGSGNFTATNPPGGSQNSWDIALGDIDGDGTIPPVDDYGLPNINSTGYLPNMFTADVNDNAPVITTAGTQTVAENTKVVAALASTDVDTVGTNPATFSITGGADGDLFAIVSGDLVFKTAPNYETDPHSYQVEVSANDGVNTTAELITVNLTDVNEAPTAVTLSNATTYTLTDLGPGSASAINNAGQVAGTTGQHATIWNGTTPTDLGTLGGTQSQASGINEIGQVVGVSEITVNGVLQQHATIWMGSVPTDLTTLGGGTSYATSINDAGQVVGASNTNGDVASHAVIWKGGTITDLGTLGGTFSNALDINNAGQVVGYADTTGNAYQRATLWSGGISTDLGTLGGGISQAFGINDAGQVVGVSATTGDTAYHATLWNINTNTITDLGTLGGTSLAIDINSAGQVVGTSGDDLLHRHATLWNGGTPIDLSTVLDSSGVGWTLELALSINDFGQIVGYGTTMPLPPGGSGSVTYHAVLLTPTEIPAVPSSIAENTSIATHIKVASINVTDDALGTNMLGLIGADATFFEIIGGALYLRAGTVLDFESKTSYSVAVTVDDPTVGATPDATSATYTLNITDANDNAPVITAAATQSMAENQTVVAALTSTDADTVGINPATFSITGGANAALFDIIGSNLVFNAVPNYEIDPHSYQVEVSAFDGVNTTTKTITVNLTDVNDNAPVITTAATQSVAENSTFVAALTSTDADSVGTNPAAFSITGGTNAALFDIVGGDLVFKTAPNYETNPHSYQVEVSAFDGVNTTTKTITVNLTDVNEAPKAVALANATTSILENTPTATHIKVADINVTDDALGSNILAPTGVDAAFFEIVGSALYLKAGTVLDFESKTSYAVAVTLDDPTVGATPDATSTIYALNVSNVPGVTITGTSAANTIDATHTVAGQPLPTNEEDTINAGGGNDTINALGGNDFINGGVGADTMSGGTGNDTYVVDNGGDIVNETGGNGLDTVQSSITFGLSDAVHAIGVIENLTLTGTAAINGTGNALANLITGNSGNNVIAGLGGADILNGGGGTDTATYATSPVGVNVSLMTGLGNGGDAQGDNLINFENLTGSNFSDILEGNAGTNVLNGGAGIDTVSYEHATAAVTVNLATTSTQNTGGAGSDTLSNFENLIGSAFNDTLTGSASANAINGGAGNDTIKGGGGADILTGGPGNDSIVFAALTDSPPAAPDIITDFTHGADIINLSAIDANTSFFAFGNQAFAYGGQNANVVARSVTWFESNGNTIVQADVNGNASADLTIMLVGINLNLTQQDFLL